ncbi:aldose 1-epimerase [Alicyclobacillus tolerans]|uniref:aldose 1-epimerase n=1 Tax=Alicyclobacillus tolerans TaxID=90970 RepID=UPI001F403B01|nr:aldose 1-epimerase [Alicyclobacillus tolerans]MCF8566679.1 aldose 1-epimerase [Alicyclobacillus tolerans]
MGLDEMTANRLARTSGCRIETAWSYQGMRTLVLQNEKLRLSFLLDKGADLFELVYKPIDLDVLYRAPRGIRNPLQSWRPGSDDAVYHDYYGGGWQEVFPSGSGASSYQGAFLGFHGEVASLPWDVEVVEDTPKRVCVRLYVRTVRTPFCLVKEIELAAGESKFSVKEWVTNEGKTPLHFMWGHHPAFGAPLISERAQIDLPACTVESHPMLYSERSLFGPESKGVWPYLPNRRGELVDLRHLLSFPDGSSDMLYAKDLAEAKFDIHNPDLEVTLHFEWDKEAFPYLWIWREAGGTLGYPWYGSGNVIALEPFSSLPGTGEHGLLEAIANETAQVMQAGDTKTTAITVGIQPFKPQL